MSHGGALRATVPVTADVINASGSRGFNAFTLQDCYNFHGWSERATVDESLGGGITGQALSYDSSAVRRLVRPVLDLARPGHGGQLQRHPLRARRALRPGRPAGIGAGPQDRFEQHGGPTLDQRLRVDRDFLTVFASEIIKEQKAATTASTETEAAG